MQSSLANVRTNQRLERKKKKNAFGGEKKHIWNKCRYDLIKRDGKGKRSSGNNMLHRTETSKQTWQQLKTSGADACVRSAAGLPWTTAGVGGASGRIGAHRSETGSLEIKTHRIWAKTIVAVYRWGRNVIKNQPLETDFTPCQAEWKPAGAEELKISRSEPQLSAPKESRWEGAGRTNHG